MKSKKRIIRLLEHATKERTLRVGRTTEDKFLEAMTSHDSPVAMPAWIQDIYLTKPYSEEDNNKIDAVVVTDVGKLYLQIKSSQKGAAKHFGKFGKRDARKNFIGVLVILSTDTRDQIRRVTRQVLEDLHQKVLSIRS